MFEVVKAGLETSVQDYPGRVGYWNQGFPPSGPMDSWSFRLGNVLVGNQPGDAGLECQYIGPTLRFIENTVIAVCGADMTPKLDGHAMPMWTAIAAQAGQVLELGPARTGVRGYISISGGVTTPPWLGSRSTFHKAGVGGVDGHALQEGQRVPCGKSVGHPGRVVTESARPVFAESRVWDVEVVAGPNDDWLDEAGKRTFLAAEWKLSPKSDRTGYRLGGPELSYSEKAHNKLPEHGSEPSNIIDQGYPIGAINICGSTPIILVNDGPSMGGFINPFTVPSAAFWKLGQAKPGEILHFRTISVEEAQAMARRLTEICSERSIAKRP